MLLKGRRIAHKREGETKSRDDVSMGTAGCSPSTFLSLENQVPRPFVLDGQRDPCMLDLDICFIKHFFSVDDDHPTSQQGRDIGAPWTL